MRISIWVINKTINIYFINKHTTEIGFAFSESRKKEEEVALRKLGLEIGESVGGS